MSVSSNSPAGNIRILIADDHTMVRTGLQMMLELKFGITTAFEANSCAEVLSHIREYKPTHLIIDMIFKDGNSIEILPAIKGLMPKLKIMVYSMLPTEVYQPALQKFGISYYLNKEMPQHHTIQMISRFLHEAPMMQAIPEQLSETQVHPFASLSTRELEVLHYILKGESVSFAASALNLHKSTISTLKRRIFEKVGVRNTKGLLDMATLHSYAS